MKTRNFVRDRTEWDRTDVGFESAKTGDQTEIRFTHLGLVPAIECDDGCSGAWGHRARLAEVSRWPTTW